MTDFTDRDEAIKEIRRALKQRSGKSWSVTGGRGTGWGWITVHAPPSRRGQGYMSDADREELGRLLGKDSPVHHQGETIPASSNYRREYVALARGETPETVGSPYWD